MNAPMINLLAAAATLGEMGERLSRGEEIGSLFVTDPTLSEYQLYAEAKREREAKEAEKAKAARGQGEGGSGPSCEAGAIGPSVGGSRR